MKRILKENKNCLILLFLIILSAFLTSCGGVTPTNPVINFFSASPTTITAGDSSTLSWIVTDATSATIDLGVGSVASTTGTTSVSPAVTTTYTLTATNSAGSTNETVTITVNPAIEFPVNNTDTGVGYNTIQSAIDTALSGHTIVVSPGTYYENIIFNNKNITVRSSNPSDSDIVAATIIDGGESDSVVRITGEDTSTLQGFTIQNGNAAYGGGGICVENSSPVIENNTITDNMSEFSGGGIYTFQSSPTITDNTISYNAAGYGGGIFISSSNPNITGNTIADNIITDNTASYHGGGIYMDGSSPIITGNTVTGNTAIDGGGIFLFNNHPFITGNTVTGNIAGAGGGILLKESYPFITGNTIDNNTASSEGGGIAVTVYSDPVITGNYIRHNVADNGGGIFVDNTTCSPAIGGTSSSDKEKFNTFCGNSTDQIVPDDYPNNFIFEICFYLPPLNK
jgi:parallel beta-helix repeat protein